MPHSPGVSLQSSSVDQLQVTWTRPHILLLDEPSNHLVRSTSLPRMTWIMG